MHDLLLQAGDLDVHLNGCDALRCTAHLEVHVAEMVLVTEDVGQDGVLLAFHDEPHRDACHRGLDGDTRVHHREAASADRCHRGRTVRLGNLRDDSHGVGELLVRGQHLGQRALGEVAVANLPPSGTAEELRLPDRVGREIVVQNERLVEFLREPVDLLLVLARPKGRGHDALCLASREQGRPVYTRQETHLDGDRPYGLVVATVDATLIVEHLCAHRVVAQLLVGVLDGALEIRKFRRELGDDFLLDLAEAVVPRKLLRDIASVDDLLKADCLDAGVDLLVALRGREGPLFLPDGLANLPDQLEDALHGLMTELNGVDHVLFGHLRGLTLDHDDGVLRSGDQELALAVLLLFVGRVCD